MTQFSVFSSNATMVRRICQICNFWVTLFLKCLKLKWIKHNSYTFRSAVRAFCGAPRPTCDNVIVNVSAPAPRRDDVILICDSDSQYMASVPHIFTDMLHPTGAVKTQYCPLPLWMHQSKPCQQLLPVGEERLRTSLSVIHAELSLSGKRGWESAVFTS